MNICKIFSFAVCFCLCVFNENANFCISLVLLQMFCRVTFYKEINIHKHDKMMVSMSASLFLNDNLWRYCFRRLQFIFENHFLGFNKWSPYLINNVSQIFIHWTVLITFLGILFWLNCMILIFIFTCNIFLSYSFQCKFQWK